MKLWVIADAATGYAFDYEVYTGKSGTVLSKFELGYSVVMRLIKIYLDKDTNCLLTIITHQYNYSLIYYWSIAPQLVEQFW